MRHDLALRDVDLLPPEVDEFGRSVGQERREAILPIVGRVDLPGVELGVGDQGRESPEGHATLRSWLDADFESEQVRTAFAAWGLHVGTAPDDLGGIAASAFGTVIQVVGNNPVRGGMQHLPEALARFLRENGGEI